MNIPPKHDHYKTQIDYIALIIWVWLTLVTAWGAWLTYRDIHNNRRVDEIEMWQGPNTVTEWTVVNGKVMLYQSPYYIQVTP